MTIMRTAGDERWIVRRSKDGEPLEVSAIERHLRGSFSESLTNHALAVWHLKAALWRALPSWLRRIVPSPRKWWTV